ncbi:hypothetical protein CBS101457_002571 [Exobasidium rhododendri]|nr:hypothetical protein CBS101457_002571 [Exobasidium rhododendri]
MVLQALHNKVVGEKTDLHGSMRLITWLQSDHVKEGNEKAKSSLYESLLDLCLASSLLLHLSCVIDYLGSTEAEGVFPLHQADNAEYGKLIARAGISLSQRVDDEALSSMSERLITMIDTQASAMHDSPANTTEICKACGSDIILDPDSMLLSKCQKGHLWTMLHLVGHSRNKLESHLLDLLVRDNRDKKSYMQLAASLTPFHDSV